MDDLTHHELAVLLFIAFLSFGAMVMENVVWGPVQGCRIAFAGAGFGC